MVIILRRFSYKILVWISSDDRNKYFRRVEFNPVTNPLNNKWKRVENGKVTFNFEELVHRSNNERIILKQTDQENLYVYLSSIECKWGYSVDKIDVFFEHGTWN